MADYTRLTNLEVTGSLKTDGGLEVADKLKAKSGLDITESNYAVTASDGGAAASTAPTKAEFDAVVTLANALKASFNKLVKQLATGSDT